MLAVSIVTLFCCKIQELPVMFPNEFERGIDKFTCPSKLGQFAGKRLSIAI